MRVLKREELSLPTDLTQDEFNLKARELAETHEALAREREAQKETKAQMKARVEELEQKRTELARIVKARKEDRLVDVEEHANDERGIVECVRMDTGEIYTQRPLAAGERQLTLLEGGKGPKSTRRSPTDTTQH